VFNSNCFGSRNKSNEWRKSKLPSCSNERNADERLLHGSTSFDVKFDVIVELALRSEHVSRLRPARLEFRTTLG